jgi:hypothetical protein
MLRSAINSFTRVFDAPPARLRASSTRYGGVVRCNPGSIVPLALLWVPALLRVRDTRRVRSPLRGDLPVGQRLGWVERKRYPSISLRVRGDLLCFLKLIWVVQSLLQKYFCFRTPQITSITLAIPPHKRGVS